MKKILSNQIYNTETADLVGEYSNGHHFGDYNYLSETLYKTKKSNFFIWGEGGANTGYAERSGNERSSGSKIRSLTEFEAFEWAAEHLSPELVEKHFAKHISEA